MGAVPTGVSPMRSFCALEPFVPLCLPEVLEAGESLLTPVTSISSSVATRVSLVQAETS